MIDEKDLLRQLATARELIDDSYEIIIVMSQDVFDEYEAEYYQKHIYYSPECGVYNEQTYPIVFGHRVVVLDSPNYQNEAFPAAVQKQSRKRYEYERFFKTKWATKEYEDVVLHLYQKNNGLVIPYRLEQCGPSWPSWNECRSHMTIYTSDPFYTFSVMAYTENAMKATLIDSNSLDNGSVDLDTFLNSFHIIGGESLRKPSC